MGLLGQLESSQEVIAHNFLCRAGRGLSARSQWERRHGWWLRIRVSLISYFLIATSLPQKRWSFETIYSKINKQIKICTKGFPNKTQLFAGENASVFPCRLCIFKGRFMRQETAFGSHLGRRSSLLFASLISPFVLSWSSDKSHGSCWKAILNPRFACQMYRRLKPD